MRRLLSLLMLLILPLLAQPKAQETVEFRVTFLTEPTGARVMGNVSYLGLTGEPIEMKVPLDRQRVVVTFELEGYHPHKQSIPLYELKSSPTYPPSGPIRLSPVNQLIPLKRFVSAHPYSLGGLALLLIPALLLLAKRRSALHEKVNRAGKLEQLKARAMTEDDLIMTTLGRWRLTQLLGIGGMSAVYLGLPNHSLAESEAVAIKVIHREVIRNPEFKARFQREIRLYRELTHPHITLLIDWGEQDGLTYLVLELMDGDPLDELIPEGGLPPRKALELLEPLVDAVSYAHSKGVIHRDLKPENVMRTRGGIIKLMDFGLARKMGSKTITQKGEFMGTPAFVSPEQVTGKAQVGPAADQYSLACIAFNLLCGRVPFECEDPQQQVFQQAFEPPPLITQFNPDLPAAVDDVLLRMLEKDSANRYLSVDEAYQALRQALKL